MKPTKYSFHTIIFILLSIFTFAFAHSELDQCRVKDDDHSQHDYKTLVKTTLLPVIHSIDNIKTKSISFETNHNFYNDRFLYSGITATLFEFNLKYLPYKSKDIYILKCTLIV